jgi:hypothetical protein
LPANRILSGKSGAADEIRTYNSNLARFRSIARERVHARGDVGRFPEYFAARFDDDGSGIGADAGGGFRRVSRVPGVEAPKTRAES